MGGIIRRFRTVPEAVEERILRLWFLPQCVSRVRLYQVQVVSLPSSVVVVHPLNGRGMPKDVINVIVSPTLGSLKVQQVHHFLKKPDVNRRIGDPGGWRLWCRYPRRVIPAEVFGRDFSFKPWSREVLRRIPEIARL